MTVVGRFKATRPWRSRLLLFQSWGQFCSYLISVSLVLLVAECVVRAAGSQLTLEPVIGGLLGTLAAVQITETCAFNVQRDSLGNIRQAIEARLARAGFIAEGSGSIMHYRHKWPRWLTFRDTTSICKREKAGRC